VGRIVFHKSITKRIRSRKKINKKYFKKVDLRKLIKTIPNNC